jgi:hypothetical protein
MKLIDKYFIPYKDKWMHFICGAVISTYFGITLHMNGMDKLYALIAVFVIGVAKETWDWTDGEDFDLTDLAATMAGGIFALCFFYL